MKVISQKSDWAFISLLFMLFGCATEPYYEAAPITPTNVSPGEDIEIGVNASTTFTWLSTENAQYYEFHIYNQKTKDTVQYLHDQLLGANICQDGRCSLTLNVDLPTVKGHAWRVRAGNNAGLSEWNRTRFNMVRASTEASTSTESIAAESAESSTESSTEASTEASAEAGESVDLSVAVQASENGEVSQAGLPDVESEEIPSVELVTDAEQSVENVEDAVALDTSESETSDSETALLKANSQPESTGPELIQPDEDVNVATGSLVDFKWRSLPDAVSYDFFIYDSVSKEMVESLTNIAATSLCTSENVCGLTREIALPEAHHSWRVRANFEDGKSPYSSHRFVITP